MCVCIEDGLIMREEQLEMICSNKGNMVSRESLGHSVTYNAAKMEKMFHCVI